MKLCCMLGLLHALALLNCTNYGDKLPKGGQAVGANAASATLNSGMPLWARSTVGGSGSSEFYAVRADSTGNIIAAGRISGNGAFDFGSGATATGAYASGTNVLIIKYASPGNAVWARSNTVGSASAYFQGVAIDSAGNAYAVGTQSGNGSFTYGSQSVSGSYASGSNALIVKYDSTGTVSWARTTAAGSNVSGFRSVAVDSSGNVYAVGDQYGTGTYTYGTQSINGTSIIQNAIIVKYNSSGTVLWARTVSAGTVESGFEAVAIDSAGNAYAAGDQGGGSVTYGTQSIAGTALGSGNPVLVKYDSSGTAQWARTISAGTSSSWFFDIGIDNNDNVITAGYQTGTGTFTYSGQSISGPYSGANATVVKYDSNGNGIWARVVNAGLNVSRFNGISVDGNGNIYCSGYQQGNGIFTFSAQNVTAAYGGGNNANVVKYDSGGTAVWARSTITSNNNSRYEAVTVDTLGRVTAVGYQNSAATISYGSGVNAIGAFAGGNNVLMVQYQ